MVRRTRFDNLYIVPGTPLLHRLDSGGYARPDAELKFVKDVRLLTVPDGNGASEPFDWIIIDTPPAQGYFTRSALAAADHIVIPAFAERYAIDGIGAVRQSIQTMRALVGTASSWSTSVLGCVITRWKSGQVADISAQDIETQLPNDGIRVFRTRISADDRIEQAHLQTMSGQRRNIFQLTNRPGPAAQAYNQFVKEMLNYANGNQA